MHTLAKAGEHAIAGVRDSLNSLQTSLCNLITSKELQSAPVLFIKRSRQNLSGSHVVLARSARILTMSGRTQNMFSNLRSRNVLFETHM